MAETQAANDTQVQKKPLTRTQIEARRVQREQEATKAKNEADALRLRHETEAKEEADHAFDEIDAQLKDYAEHFSELQRRSLAALLGFGVEEPPAPTARKTRAKKGEGKGREPKKNPDIYEVGDRKWNGVGAMPRVFYAWAETPEGKKFREANPTKWPAIGSGMGKGMKTVPQPKKTSDATATKPDSKATGAKAKT